MMKINRIILSGGGTGGHIYPALAIYNRMKELNPDLECLYIGTDKGLEASIVPKANIDFKSIEISGLKRSLSLDNIKVAWQMLTSTQKAKKLIKEFQPELVIGTGGFVCAPVLYGATQLGIPTLIHEQNSVAGVTNKFLSRFVDKVATSFYEVENDFAKVSQKVAFTGNPRGQEVTNYAKDEHILSKNYGFNDQLPTVLIFGGSRGAPAINKAAVESIEDFAKKEYQVIIGTGSVHHSEWMNYIEDNQIKIPNNVKIVPYIDNMPALFQRIDLVVCRSGATTLAELTTLGLPSILIPSPYVTNNHQEMNAIALVNNQAAEMIKESQLDSSQLVHTIDRMILDQTALNEMAENAKKLGTPHAIDDIIKLVESI
ncbi:MAG TPA: undecaprenyldiphospho-muramoylpentapeptide beta-N-acetylglucosaminyltransferase [Aerococcaceae bacterium]|nr:undecaprenyldiphospho-muramoylpentapeptide beta-N-acetylglucosaminyltransferase [Aerococcaceae bacterium]